MEKDSNTFDDFVRCPYNKAHKVLKGRLATHLDRCARNSGASIELKICPFNSTHRFSAKEMPVSVFIYMYIYIFCTIC